MSNLRFFVCGHVLLTASFLAAAFASGPPPQNKASTEEKAKWQALSPTIERVLARRGLTCTDQTVRVGIVEAAEFAGRSVALVKYCPGGAYTDWIVAMQLEASQPVLTRFRSVGGKVGDLEFAQGASVMHGKGVKLVPEKSAIYDISWDYDGPDEKGTQKLDRCVVDAYVLNSKANIFVWDVNLTKQATRSYCQTLQQQGH